MNSSSSRARPLALDYTVNFGPGGDNEAYLGQPKSINDLSPLAGPITVNGPS